MNRILPILLICCALFALNPVWADSPTDSSILIAQADTAEHSEGDLVEGEHEEGADHAAEGEGHDAASVGHGEEHGGSHGPALGPDLPLWTCIPFVGILLSIALFPLFAPHFWHHHFAKISAFWALLLAVPFLFAFQGAAVYEILHIYILDYIPFIILLWALYTISGGILLSGTLVGTPIVNTGLLLIGTILASWMGTTGAAMLLIRPFLRANRHRKDRTFMVVFFIFLVANIGGSLTPLGDPPLFLGFLHKVPFFWTFNLAPHMIMVAAILLIMYFFLDSRAYAAEGEHPISETVHPLRLYGSYNFLFLGGVVCAVLMSGLADFGEVTILGIHTTVQSLLRDAILIVMGGCSLYFTPWKLRDDNDFTWFPIKEVAYLFAGIFMTMIPCLLILKAGSEGAAAALVTNVKEPFHFFWITGILSSFLDNAPTYLTFFTTALGRFYPGMAEAQAVPLLIAENEIFLKAISAGAVFFGAVTYIGNAPNFMVRSIAEDSGTPMPSFFGYMFKYAFVYLIPVFVLVTLVFFWFV